MSPQASVHASAVVEAGVQVGPFSVIGPQVILRAGVEIKSHVVVTGRTEIGPDSTVFPFASVGEVPQDLKFKGEASRLVIGARTGRMWPMMRRSEIGLSW
jgi:UDP-N-acetylglucosamine acyltransferase